MIDSIVSGRADESFFLPRLAGGGGGGGGGGGYILGGGFGVRGRGQS